MLEDQRKIESIQILNTAIIKSKEKLIDESYEERLGNLCSSPALDALNKAICNYADTEKVSRDQAAIQIVEIIRELDSIWNDYVLMEGIDRLKSVLKGNTTH